MFWPENNKYYGLEYENAPYYPRKYIINVTVKQNNDEIIEVRLLPPEARSTKVLPKSAFLNNDKKKIEKGYMAIASLRSPHDKSYDDLIIQNSIMCTGKPIMIRIGNQFRKSRIFIPSLQHYKLKCYPRSVEIEDVRQLNVVNNKILNLESSEEAPNSVSHLLVDTDTDKGKILSALPIAGPNNNQCDGKDDYSRQSEPTTSSVLRRETTLITNGKEQLSREVKIKIISDVVEQDINYLGSIKD